VLLEKSTYLHNILPTLGSFKSKFYLLLLYKLLKLITSSSRNRSRIKFCAIYGCLYAFVESCFNAFARDVMRYECRTLKQPSLCIRGQAIHKLEICNLEKICYMYPELSSGSGIVVEKVANPLLFFSLYF
jgi:hypothetical protein